MNFSMFTKEQALHANRHVGSYLDQVERLQKDYPSLREYELLPLLLPATLVLTETSLGQATNNPLKTRAANTLEFANALTVLYLINIAPHLHNYRNSGWVTASLLRDCLDEFLRRMGIQPETVTGTLERAQRAIPLEED